MFSLEKETVYMYCVHIY